MKAGKRDRLISVERYTITEDAFGGTVETWAAHLQAWAQIIYGTGQERREAGRENASQPATFRLLADSDTLGITTDDRIAFDGDTWDIVSLSPLGRDGLEITAARGS
ncbi:MAG: head-tail adaptor protein [Sphingomonadaceae bacterium]